MDPMITGLAIVSLMGAAATIAGAAEDLESDVERLEEKVKDLEYDIQENYRPIPYSEMVGISDSDFIEVR